jgi:hypothetical protein
MCSVRGLCTRRHSWAIGLSVYVLITIAGCSSGPPGYKIAGKVVDGDKPVLPDPNLSLRMTFMQVVEEGKAYNLYSTMLKPEDGSFEMLGNDSSGVPAGKYRVKFMSMSPTSATTKFLNARFRSDASPILIDIVDDKAPVVIDISSYKKK